MRSILRNSFRNFEIFGGGDIGVGSVCRFSKICSFAAVDFMRSESGSKGNLSAKILSSE